MTRNGSRETPLAGAVGADVDPLSSAQYPPEGGFPLAWLQACSRRFLSDWREGAVRVPLAAETRGRVAAQA